MVQAVSSTLNDGGYDYVTDSITSSVCCLYLLSLILRSCLIPNNNEKKKSELCPAQRRAGHALY